jgi:hypothetical protein
VDNQNDNTCDLPHQLFHNISMVLWMAEDDCASSESEGISAETTALMSPG